MGEARIEHDAGWTDDRVATLKRMWADGKSAGEIRNVLGGGVTRSAVIGKVHRLKLAGRAATGASAQRRPKAAQPRGQKGQPKVNAILRYAADARAQPTPPAFEPEPFDAEVDVGIDVTKRIGLMGLNERTCKWPVGSETGARQMFCGCRKGRDDGPYCPEHTARAEYRR